MGPDGGLLLVVLVAPLFGPPAGPLRLAAGFTTGQLDAGGTAAEDHLRGGRFSVEWLGEEGTDAGEGTAAGTRSPGDRPDSALHSSREGTAARPLPSGEREDSAPVRRVGLSYRGQSVTVERRCRPPSGASATSAACPQGGATGLASRHEVTFTGGFGFEWLALSGGLALERTQTTDALGVTEVDTRPHPAFSARLGPPDLLCLRAAWRDVGPEVPGTARGRAGLELAPGANGRVFAGALWEGRGWGVLLAGALPLSEHVAIAVEGAANPGAPERLVLLGAGLIVRLDPAEVGDEPVGE